jgi:hypothetical protein
MAVIVHLWSVKVMRRTTDIPVLSWGVNNPAAFLFHSYRGMPAGGSSTATEAGCSNMEAAASSVQSLAPHAKADTTEVFIIEN